MASNLPPHGEILRLSEVRERGPLIMAGKSVRVMGKLTQYDAVKQLAVIQASERNATHRLHVNTRLIEPFQSRIGSMFQFIGEMPSEIKSESDMVLLARVVRCVDGIDVTMYYNACDVQRNYLASRISAASTSSSS
ncbi:CST complex subunit TEN1-like [Lytechinus variegatus]|uniref:CST complex subunit TEN1-like n=1 Tax=Lytechinus variegatus TaxID=7654 RepID=UPI001BB1D5E1|nr:CST complex subunit TEN1-like [Lytechinus variegatus]